MCEITLLRETVGEDTSKIGHIFYDIVPNTGSQRKRRPEKKFYNNFTEPYTVTRRQVFEDNFGLSPHECGLRIWQYPECNNTIIGFWVRVNSNINWLSEDGGIWVSSHHQGYILFSKTYSDAPVHFATDWVLAKTEPFPKSIHLKDGSLSIEVLNANKHPLTVFLRLIEEEMVIGKIE